MKTETGGWAFPANHFDLTDAEHGMSLRDYFAAKTMQALVSKYGDEGLVEVVVDKAYEYADAMLEARKFIHELPEISEARK
jgi:hypothetical protein